MRGARQGSRRATISETVFHRKLDDLQNGLENDWSLPSCSYLRKETMPVYCLRYMAVIALRQPVYRNIQEVLRSRLDV